MITQDHLLHSYDHPEIKLFSANGVPWPLDEYLELIGKPTIQDIVEIIKRWR